MKIALNVVLSIIILLILEFVFYYLETQMQSKTCRNSFYCHLFGGIAGFLIGLRFYKDQEQYSAARIILGYIGITCFALLIVTFVAITVVLF